MEVGKEAKATSSHTVAVPPHGRPKYTQLDPEAQFLDLLAHLQSSISSLDLKDFKWGFPKIGDPSIVP